MKNISLYGAGRELIEYPTISPRAKLRRFGVPKITMATRFKLPLLVTGNGRSGTKTTSMMLRKAGFDLPHERCGKLGTVSWYFFTDSDWHPYPKESSGIVHLGERRSDFEFNRVVHLVRNPLKVIGSMWNGMTLTNHRFVADNAPELYPMEVHLSRSSRLLKTMFMSYAVWMKSIEQADFTVNIESIQAKWPALMKALGADKNTEMPELVVSNKSRGIYKARIVTYDDMEREDARLSKRIAKLASKFGYL